MIGTVDLFDTERGFGFIIGADRVRYFCHKSEIESPPLAPGDRVEFRPGLTERGPRARVVRRVPPAATPADRKGPASGPPGSRA